MNWFQVDESRTVIRLLVTSSDGTLKCNNHYKLLHCKNNIFANNIYSTFYLVNFKPTYYFSFFN
jgi:hypothetical protein